MKQNKKLAVILPLSIAVIVLFSLFVSAAWSPGTVFTPALRSAGISPSTVTANTGDSGQVAVQVFPQHPTSTAATFNKFLSFTIEGTYDAGIEITSIALPSSLSSAGWSISSTAPFDNSARTFSVQASGPAAAPITNTPTAALQINIRAANAGSPQIRLTNVRMLVAGQNGIADFAHPATVTVSGTAPTPDACAGITCQNGGSCSNGQCTCVNRYTGDRCQTAPPPSPPPPPPCQPSVTCQSANAVCGNVDNGCGTQLTCGTCTGTQQCENNQCITTPQGDQRLQRLQQDIATALDIETPADTQGRRQWNPRALARLASLLRDFFG